MLLTIKNRNLPILMLHMTRIQAIVRNVQVKKFRQKFQEGHCCFITKFEVVGTYSKYRAVPNNMWIIFYFTIILQEVQTPTTEIPLVHFHFTDMLLISERGNKNTYLKVKNKNTPHIAQYILFSILDIIQLFLLLLHISLESSVE